MEFAVALHHAVECGREEKRAYIVRNSSDEGWQFSSSAFYVKHPALVLQASAVMEIYPDDTCFIIKGHSEIWDAVGKCGPKCPQLQLIATSKDWLEPRQNPVPPWGQAPVPKAPVNDLEQFVPWATTRQKAQKTGCPLPQVITEELWWEQERREQQKAKERLIALRNDVRKICGM